MHVSQSMVALSRYNELPDAVARTKTVAAVARIRGVCCDSGAVEEQISHGESYSSQRQRTMIGAGVAARRQHIRSRKSALGRGGWTKVAVGHACATYLSGALV